MSWQVNAFRRHDDAQQNWNTKGNFFEDVEKGKKCIWVREERRITQFSIEERRRRGYICIKS